MRLTGVQAEPASMAAFDTTTPKAPLISTPRTAQHAPKHVIASRQEVGSAAPMSGCCASCLVPIDDDDPLLTAVGLCSRCEMACMAARARARQAASLTALLDEDSLVLALAFACMGRGGHRQGRRLCAINHAFRRVVTEQLWRALCLAEHSVVVVERLLLSIPVPSTMSGSQMEFAQQCLVELAPGPALAPLGTDWAAAHRLLSVPLRFRNRSCRSWGRMLRLRHRGLDKPSVLRIDASAASQLSPGFGFTSWRGADELLSSTGRGAIGGPEELERELDRECQRRQRHDLSHDGDSDYSTHSHEDDAVADGDRVAGPASTALLCCVLREVSSEHLLLSGVLPSLSLAARKEIEALPVGIAPMHGGDSRHAPTPWANSKGPPPQRCLCCATHLRKLKGDSGAVCAHGPGHVMRDARAWFKEAVTRWRPAAKEAAGAGDDKEANTLPIASCHAQAAGDAFSDTEAHGGHLEDEDVGEEDKAEFVGAEGASGDHAEAYDATLTTALVCPHGHVVLIYDLEPAEEEEEGDDDEDEDEDEDEDWEDEWDEDEDEDEWDGEEEDCSWDEDGDEDEDDDEDDDDDDDENDEDSLHSSSLPSSHSRRRKASSRPQDVVQAAFSY